VWEEAEVHDHEPGECKQLFDAISPYLDRELDAPTCDDIARHMEDCAPCRLYIESIRATRETLHRLGETEELEAGEAEALLQECLKTFRAATQPRTDP